MKLDKVFLSSYCKSYWTLGIIKLRILRIRSACDGTGIPVKHGGDFASNLLILPLVEYIFG